MNFAGGTGATVPGGGMNAATGDHSFAAGQRAWANHAGTFVWADSQSEFFVSSNATSGAGATWTSKSSGLPTRFATQVVVNPKTPATIYATFSGYRFGSDTAGHVFRSPDCARTTLQMEIGPDRFRERCTLARCWHDAETNESSEQAARAGGH